MLRNPALCALAVTLAPGAWSQAPPTDCGFLGHEEVLDAFRAAVAAGRVAPPSTGPLDATPPAARAASSGTPCLTHVQLFAYEDSSQVLLSNFSTGELLGLMTEAANALLAAHGDGFDFLGYWVTFTPDHQIGAAFYAQLANDTLGIGLPFIDNRAAIGLASTRIDGYVMMWRVDEPAWEPGAGPGAEFTRLVLAQEFEHRWALFLPDLLDGRRLQGNNGNCGRSAHWNFKVDGQGSGMEISEWVGSGPATRVGGSLNFNTDTGGVFSHTDLYLMGYDSPAEMDAGNSELRYMNSSDCASPYGGTITHFTSADVIAAAGPRVPGSTAAPKDFRTAWILLHLPGAPPTGPQLDKVVGILEQHQLDWVDSTLGRGTMDNSLFDDCNCNGVPDAVDVAAGTSADLNGNGLPDECEELGTRYCTPSVPNSTGASAQIAAIGDASAATNDLTLVATALPPNRFGYFLTSETQSFVPLPGGGNFCLGGDIARFASQIQSSGPAGTFHVAINLTAIPPPAQTVVVPGDTWHFQSWFRDAIAVGSSTGFTDAISIPFE